MANPFNGERRQQLQDDAAEFLKTFGIQYSKLLGVCTVEKIEKENSEKEINKKKLKYRNFDLVMQRPNLFQGEAYVKVGGGPGGFTKFQPCYIVEKKDYNLELYSTKKDYEGKKKPKHTIAIAGYELVKNTSDHYYMVLHELASGLGLSDEQLRSKTTFSQYSWALSHPWRTNYIFQLHKVKESGGCCGGDNAVEPEGVGKEEAKERNNYIQAFQRCINKVKPRNTRDVKGKTFERAAAKMTVLLSERLGDFKDDGTESQILTDMLLQQCFTPIRDELINDMKGPLSVKLKIWFKMRVVIHDVLKNMVDPAWANILKAANTTLEKIEPALKKGIEPFVEAKMKIKSTIREKISQPVSEVLKDNVTPFIEPIVKALEQPLKKAFDHQRQIYVTKVPEIESLPDDEKQRNKELDKIPRDKMVVKEMVDATHDLVKPIESIQKLSEKLFINLDPYKYRQECEDNLLETLDASIHTLEKEITEQGKKNEHKEGVLLLFDHDIQYARAEFVKAVLCDLLVGGFKRALQPLTDPVISTLDDLVPEAMSEFLSVAGVYEELVDLIVQEPIEKMVQSAFGV